MNMHMGEQSPLPRSDAVASENIADVSELVYQMNQVIKLLHDQKVREFQSACPQFSSLFIEYSDVYTSIWCMVVGYRCSIIILLQLRLTRTNFVDIIWCPVFIRCIISTESKGCEVARVSPRTT